ncbi:MAG: hypothetical protein NPINA01_12810 [Nitrospinaceae bacterium]|nr:MAG: hypothetical protein NPINA01_12810 [Nitrospinaceae bacterium]
MVINISHEDKQKYNEGLKNRKTRVRKKRSSLLSEKSKSEAFKKYDKMIGSESNNEVQIDEHVKMNDNFMRTGPYRPKKK